MKNDFMQEKPYIGLIRSLQKNGCSHLLDVYCQGLTSQRGRSQHDLEFIELQVWFSLCIKHYITLSFAPMTYFSLFPIFSSMKLLGVGETGITLHLILLLSHQFHIIAVMDNISMKTCTGIFLGSCVQVCYDGLSFNFFLLPSVIWHSTWCGIAVWEHYKEENLMNFILSWKSQSRLVRYYSSTC